jgi:hypothetical protein
MLGYLQAVYYGSLEAPISVQWYFSGSLIIDSQKVVQRRHHFGKVPYRHANQNAGMRLLWSVDQRMGSR